LFIVKVKKIRVINEVNDISVEVECYLTCEDEAIFKDSDGGNIKTFIVRVPKSSLDDGLTFEQKLVYTAINVMYLEFSVNVYAEKSYPDYIEPFATNGTNTLLLSEDDVKKLNVGMALVGPGYNYETQTDYPVIVSIMNKKEIVLSRNLHLMVEGCTVSPRLKINPTSTEVDSDIVLLADYTPPSWVVGKSITGPSIPVNTFIRQREAGALYLTQKAYATCSGGYVIISKHPNSQYLIASKMVMDERYIGLPVSGFGIVANTKTKEIDFSKDDNPYSLLENITSSDTTIPLDNNAVGTAVVDTDFKTYVLVKINVSVPSWVRLYASFSNRDADIDRVLGDPPNAGVISEIITSEPNQTILIPPTEVVSASGHVPETQIPIAVTNLSGITQPVTVAVTIKRNCIKLSNYVNMGVTSSDDSFCDFDSPTPVYTFGNSSFTFYVMPDGREEDPWGASNIDFSDLLLVAELVNLSEM